jgi:hypothetical protein
MGPLPCEFLYCTRAAAEAHFRCPRVARLRGTNRGHLFSHDVTQGLLGYPARLIIVRFYSIKVEQSTRGDEEEEQGHKITERLGFAPLSTCATEMREGWGACTLLAG